MHEFWHDYVKQKYGEKAKLCYLDTTSNTVFIKPEDLVKDVETIFDTSSRELEKPLPNKSY